MDSLAGINLNLLVALDALLTEGSVTRAAQRIGVTQSAMSHTLRQLRELFDDPLLVRAGRRMVPTPRAAALRPELRTAMGTLETVVAHRGTFDPARFTGQLTLATQDGVVTAFSETLFPAFRREAPHAELRLARPPDDLAAALEDGRVDVATAPPIDIPAGLVRQEVPRSQVTWAVVADTDHPATELDLHAFCHWPHAAMSISGSGPSLVDHALARLGRERRIAARVPWLLAIPHVLRGTDMISVVVSQAAAYGEAFWRLKRFPCPVPLPGASMQLLWHARYEADPAHRWFRELIIRMARQTGDFPGTSC